MPSSNNPYLFDYDPTMYCTSCEESYLSSDGHVCDPLIECDTCSYIYRASEGHECEDDGECHCPDCIGAEVSPTWRAQMLRSMVITERIR